MVQIPDPPNTEPVTPFDLGAEAPTLPQGTSCLPPDAVYDAPPDWAPSDYPAPVVTYTDPADPSQPTPEWMAEINTLPAAQRELVLAWWPHIWNKPSEYLDGKFVLSISALLMHAEAYQTAALKRERKEAKDSVVKRRVAREARKEANREYGLRHLAWQKDCAARNEWIESKCAEWKRRVAAKQTAMKEWDAYVEQAREEYRAAKATPVPPCPER